MGRRRLPQPLGKTFERDGRHEGAGGHDDAGPASSPDGNGHDDTIALGWTASQACHGTVRIIDSGGTSRRLWTYTDKTAWSTNWNGKDDDGTTAAGRPLHLPRQRPRRAGNLRIVDKTILLDRTLKSHTWSDYSFDPRAGADQQADGHACAARRR